LFSYYKRQHDVIARTAGLVQAALVQGGLPGPERRDHD